MNKNDNFLWERIMRRLNFGREASEVVSEAVVLKLRL